MPTFLPEDFKPKKNQDLTGSSNDDGIIKGTCVAELEKVTRDTGEWDNGDIKDIINFQWRIKEKVTGNAHPNRVVFNKYYMTDGQYATANENRAKLANDLCTAGYDCDMSNLQDFYKSVLAAVGTVANLRLGKYNDKQTVKVVESINKDFVEKESDTTVATKDTNLPF